MSESSQDAIDKINQLASQPANPQADGGLAEGAAAMVNGSQAMLAQATSGALKFDPHTGQALINNLNQQIETLQGLGESIRWISRETKLGMTPGGQVMSRFNQEVATSGPKAFVPAHDEFVRTLFTAVQAIQIAMDNYANTDEGNAGDLKAKDWLGS
jgi:hypothetical protein